MRKGYATSAAVTCTVGCCLPDEDLLSIKCGTCGPVTGNKGWDLLSSWCLLGHLPGWWWLWLCSLLSCFSMILSFQHLILLLWKIRGIFKQTAASILKGKLGQVSALLVSPRLTEILPFRPELFSPHPHSPPALGPVWPHYELLQHIEKKGLCLCCLSVLKQLCTAGRPSASPRVRVALTSWAQATGGLSRALGELPQAIGEAQLEIPSPWPFVFLLFILQGVIEFYFSPNLLAF